MIARLGDTAEFINGGAWSDKEYTESGIPVIKVTNLKNGTVDLTEVNYIPESSLDKYGRHLLRKGDLVIATVGSHPNLVASAAGRATIIPSIAEGTLLNQNALCIRTNSENLDQGYLGYLGKSDLFQGYVKSVGRGAANQVRIALGLIKEFSFDLPPLPTQRRIASILSAYDDLIENNLKRVKLLEEKASLMYKLLQKDLTSTEKSNLYDIANIQMGFAFKAEAFNEVGEGFPIIRIRDIPNQSTKSYTTQEVDSQYWVEKGDLLIGMDGEFHMNEWLGQRGYLVQRVCRLRAKSELYQSYLWQALKEPIHYYETTISGATVAHLGKKHLEEIFLFMPKATMAKELEEMNKMRKLKIVLADQNNKLREARDILLPRLMSGQIEV
jgi:type I restriction enzyme, S subunit